MKKRLFSFVLVFAMCSMMFTGCGKSKNEPVNPNPNGADTWVEDFANQDGSENGGVIVEILGNENETSNEPVVEEVVDTTVEVEVEEEKVIDYASMKSSGEIGELEIMYSDTYVKGQGGGGVVVSYMNYYDFLNIFEDVDAPTLSTDPRNYGEVDLFMENREPTPVWLLYSRNMDACDFINENKLGEEVDYYRTWGTYSGLPEEMKGFLNEVLRTTYDMYFMSDTELGSKLGKSEYGFDEIDSLGREIEYKNYGPSSRKNNDGIQISTKGDSEWWQWEIDNFKHLESPIEKIYYFTIETEEGPEHYKAKIVDFYESQMLSTGSYFNQPGVTAVYDEYSDRYNSFIKIQLQLSRLYEE